MALLLGFIAICAGALPPPDTARPAAPRIDSIVPSAHAPADRWFAADKFWHVAVSFVNVGAIYQLSHDRAGLSPKLSAGVALGGALGLGAGKEFLDLRGPTRHFSWKDLVADLVGTGIGYVAFIHEF